MEAEMDTRTRRHPGEAARQEDGADIRALWEQWIHQLKDLHIRDALAEGKARGLAEGEARGIEKGRREAQAELRRAKERERELAEGLEQGRREAEASTRRQVVLAILGELVDDATYARLADEPSVDALEAVLRERVRALAR
jgi:hypothetical protein